MDDTSKMESARPEPPSAVSKFHMSRSKEIIDSATYPKMIDWNQFKITEPPCLQFFDDDHLTITDMQTKFLKFQVNISRQKHINKICSFGNKFLQVWLVSSRRVFNGNMTIFLCIPYAPTRK